MTRLGLAATAAAVAAGLAGCPEPRVPRPDDAPTDPATVLQRAREQSHRLSGLAVEARASYYSDRGARKGKVAILAQRPDSARFSALTPTDQLASVLATDGETFTAFERGGKVCRRGPACPENVGRLLPLVMPAGAIVHVLLGGAPRLPDADASLDWDARAGAHRVELSADGGRTVQRIWVDPEDGMVRRMELRRGDERVLRVRYRDHRDVGEGRLPHRIRVRAQRHDADLELRYRYVTPDPDFDPGAFAIDCPEGTRIERLPCRPEEGPLNRVGASDEAERPGTADAAGEPAGSGRREGDPGEGEEASAEEAGDGG